METAIPSSRTSPPAASLKPSLVEWKPALSDVPAVSVENLETFLSGMETSRMPWTRWTSTSLETFLSGMETRKGDRRAPGDPETLKPSLVEWKQTP